MLASPERTIFDQQTMVVIGVPPQGLQSREMFSGFKDYEPAAELLAEFKEQNGVRDIYKLPERRLKSAELMQSANTTAYGAAYIACKEAGIRADVTLGVSLGELGAMAIAKVIDVNSLPKIGKMRGMRTAEAIRTQQLEGLGPTGMLLIRLAKGKDALDRYTSAARPHVNDILDEVISGVSNLHDKTLVRSNTYDNVTAVLSGTKSKLQEAAAHIPTYFRHDPIEVDGAYHSPLMEPAADRFKEDLESIEFNDPSGPLLISPTTASTVISGKSAKEIAYKQLKDKVKLEEMYRNCFAPVILGSSSVRQVVFLEVGPSRFEPGTNTKTGSLIRFTIPNLGKNEIQLKDRVIPVQYGRISSPNDLETDHIKELIELIEQSKTPA